MIQKPIRYFSTNEAIFGSRNLEACIADGSLETVDLAEALIRGQASDGGLYMPTHFPSVDLQTITRMGSMAYSEVFLEVEKDFFSGILVDETLRKIAHEAYKGDTPFEPLVEPISRNSFIGRLDEGPTFAFKDYGAQVLFRVIESLMEERPKTAIGNNQHLGDIDLLTFLTATSGDTGGAMGHAVLNRKKMMMFILHSSAIGKEITDLQAKQMDTLEGNTYVIRTGTHFDGNQNFVQELMKDPEMKYMNLNSANSINLGRLLPQIAYYFYIYSRIAEAGEQLYFSVPSGNFGNADAGLFAIRLGLPAKLIIGVNKNDVFERFYAAKKYEPAEKAYSTPSSAMDVNWPSNMRRLFQLYQGQLVEGKDPKNPEKRVIEKLIMPNIQMMRQEIVGVYSISNEETLNGIKKFRDSNHMIGSLHSTLEPHGAVAYEAALRFRKQTRYDGKIVVLETAHPGKFPESLVDMGIKPQLPRTLYGLANRPHGRYFELEANYDSIKKLMVRLYQKELQNQKPK